MKQHPSTRTRSNCLSSLALLALSFSLAPVAAAASMSYAGRLVQADGSPVTGAVNLTVRFYASSSDIEPLGEALQIDNVILTDGLFEVPLELSEANAALILGDGSAERYIEIATEGRVYPRQRLAPVPFALRVPIDGTSLSYDADGKLRVGAINQDAVQGLSAALASKLGSTQALGGDLAGTYSAASVTKLQGQPIASTTPSSSQVLQWNGTAWSPQTLSLTSGTVTSVGVTAPLSVSNAATTPSISLPQATSSASGYLASSDWSAFNAKQTALGFSPLNKAGDSMGGVLQMGGQKITGLAHPTATSDATSKNYVDLNLGGMGFDQSGRANDVVVKWDNAASRFVLAADQVGSAGGGIASLNGLNPSSQTFAIGTSGTSPGFSSASSTHTLNIPLANTASVTAGLVSNAEYTTFNTKVGSVASGTGISVSTSGTTATVNLADTAVTAGSYSRANITVDAQGRLTAAASGSAVNLASDVTGSLPVTNGGTGATSAGDARTALGLGGLAVLNAVGSSEITNSSIVDADISGSAAIATSKLAGPLTAVTSHGLGALATMSSVGSSEITNSSIVDADISGSAAIATSKLSGPLTAVTSHGLGALATMSSVGTSEITDSSIVDADISGSAAISSSKISFVADGLSGNAIDGGTISNFASTGIDDNAASTVMTVTSGGNVGIGTTNPGTRLEINTPSVGYGEVRIRASGTESMIGYYSSGGNWAAGVGGWSATDKFVIGHLSTPTGAKMTIQGDGNVGISTTSPANKLTVNGSANFTGNVGIGLANPSASLHVQAASTNASAPTAGYFNSATTVTSSGAYYASGLESILAPEVASGTSNSGTLYGLSIRAHRSSATDQGTLGAQFGSWIAYGHTDATARTTSWSIGAGIYPFHAGGTITNDFGLFIATATGSTAPTNYYGIYQQDTAARNYFGGNIGIGTLTPTQQLHLTGNLLLPAGSSNTAGNIFLGGDTSAGATGMRLVSDSANNIAYLDVKNSTGGLLFRVDNTDASTARMAILPGGNVGIGTANPGAKLEIAGVAGTDGIKFPDGTIQTSARPNAQMAVADFQSMGTTYTGVPRFGTTVIGQTGSDFTFADSAQYGNSFTINTSGTYFVALWGYCNWTTNQGITAYIAKNVTAAPALNSANLLASNVCWTNATYLQAYASAVVYLSAGDVVRPFYSTVPDNNSGRFEIRRIN